MDIVVGTAGHIDHGKTALVKALTGVDADRLPEEKIRGITIDIGFAELTLGGHHVSFIDVPGHERFVKNMLAGASGIDLVVLVVAADEGVMPQTREHYDICKLLGIEAGIVALTKSDLADPETLELARMDIADLTAGSFLEDAPVIPVSSRTGDGIDKLKAALEAAANSIPRRPDDHSVHFPIDRSFAVKGFGTVVTGTLSSGEIRVGEELELLPGGRRVRVRGLQSHGNATETARAGRRVAVNLGGIDHAEIVRGELLAKPETLRPTQIINAAVDVLTASPRPLRTRQRVRIHVGTAQVLARVRVLNETGEIAPGGRDFVQLTLESPTAARLGDRFIIRSYSPQLTIAGGTVLDPLAAKLRKSEFAGARDTLARLYADNTDKSSIVSTFVEAAGERGVDLGDITAKTGWRSLVLDKVVGASVSAGSIVKASDSLAASGAFDDLKNRVISALESHHKKDPLSKGLTRETLRSQRVPAAVFDAVLAALNSENKIEILGDTIALASTKAKLSPEDEGIRSCIVARLTDSGLQVPKTEELLTEAMAGTKTSPAHARRILHLLFDSGEAVKISEEFVFSRQAIDGLVGKLREHAARGDRTIDVPKFKDIAGVSRKYAIPLLEYFDREKVTLRTGDKRVIR
jgi:selenocysteine-specific elongation factor